MMNKIQAKELYEKMFANYPDVLTVEDLSVWACVRKACSWCPTI